MKILQLRIWGQGLRRHTELCLFFLGRIKRTLVISDTGSNFFLLTEQACGETLVNGQIWRVWLVPAEPFRVSLSLSGGEWWASAGGVHHPDLWAHANPVLHPCCVRPLAGLGGRVYHQLPAPHSTWKTSPSHRCVCRSYAHDPHWWSKAPWGRTVKFGLKYLFFCSSVLWSIQSSWTYSHCLWQHWATESMKAYTSSPITIPFRRKSSTHCTTLTPTCCSEHRPDQEKPSQQRWPSSEFLTSIPLLRSVSPVLWIPFIRHSFVYVSPGVIRLLKNLSKTCDLHLNNVQQPVQFDNP